MVLLGIACLVAGIFFWNKKSNHSMFGGFGPSSTFYWGRLVTTILAITGIVLIVCGK